MSLAKKIFASAVGGAVGGIIGVTGSTAYIFADVANCGADFIKVGMNSKSPNGDQAIVEKAVQCGTGMVTGVALGLTATLLLTAGGAIAGASVVGRSRPAPTR